MPAATLQGLGIPSTVRSTEYEEHPRGRVVHSVPDSKFWLYVDRRLKAPAILSEIMTRLSLDPAKCVVRLDSHYT
jgi:hypothetical protein